MEPMLLVNCHVAAPCFTCNAAMYEACLLCGLITRLLWCYASAQLACKSIKSAWLHEAGFFLHLNMAECYLMACAVLPQGRAANFVESEQLVSVDGGRMLCSYVQVCYGRFATLSRKTARCERVHHGLCGNAPHSKPLSDPTTLFFAVAESRT